MPLAVLIARILAMFRRHKPKHGECHMSKLTVLSVLFGLGDTTPPPPTGGWFSSDPSVALTPSADNATCVADIQPSGARADIVFADANGTPVASGTLVYDGTTLNFTANDVVPTPAARRVAFGAGARR